MSQTIILEVRVRTAGLLVGADPGFRFFSSLPAFDTLDGRSFSSVLEAQRATNLVARRGHTGRAPFGRAA